jgi:hypothetical protein
MADGQSKPEFDTPEKALKHIVQQHPNWSEARLVREMKRRFQPNWTEKVMRYFVEAYLHGSTSRKRNGMGASHPHPSPPQDANRVSPMNNGSPQGTKLTYDTSAGGTDTCYRAPVAERSKFQPRARAKLNK